MWLIQKGGIELTSWLNKRLSYRRGTARRAMSVEILSTAAQLYEKSSQRSLKVIGIAAVR